MLSPDFSMNRWLSAVFISFFMLFSTPTPMLSTESNVSETTRITIAQGIEFNAKLARKSEAGAGIVHLVMLAALIVRCNRAFACPRFRKSAAIRAAFRPIVARLLTRCKLAPSRLTSIYP